MPAVPNLPAWLEWWPAAAPWVQGLFGWAGATLLWEAVLKPARERRSLSHVLADEVAVNLQIAAMQQEYVQRNPKGIPADFAFVTVGFSALAGRLSELPTKLVGDVIVFYAALTEANKIPDRFGALVDERKGLGPPGPGSRGRLRHDQLEAELDRVLVIFNGAINATVDRANALLPRLRRASVPRWRVDYLFRRKRMLTRDELRARVEDMERRRGG
jgi:hypothetical protein